MRQIDSSVVLHENKLRIITIESERLSGPVLLLHSSRKWDPKTQRKIKLGKHMLKIYF